MRRRLAALGAFALLLLLSSGGAQAAELFEDQALVDALREGGNVVVFRHARTDWSQSDDDAWRAEIEGCRAQRNLSAAGREQARLIGEAFARLAIPVGVVKASPFCRTVETATIAFGDAVVQANLRAWAPDDEAALRRTEQAIVAEIVLMPARDTNTVLLTDGNGLPLLQGALLAEGEGAAYRPDGEGGYRLIGRVTDKALVALADGLAAVSN